MSGSIVTGSRGWAWTWLGDHASAHLISLGQASSPEGVFQVRALLLREARLHTHEVNLPSLSTAEQWAPF